METARVTNHGPGEVIRRLVGRAVRGLAEQRLPLVMLFGLGAILFYAGQTGRLAGLQQAPAVADSSDAADQYMRGLRDRDVSALFGSLSPDMRRTVEQRFGRLGPAAVAALFSEQEQRGEKIAGYELIGSYQTVQGQALRFYVVHAQRGNDRADVPYTLTLGQDGKVANVE